MNTSTQEGIDHDHQGVFLAVFLETELSLEVFNYLSVDLGSACMLHTPPHTCGPQWYDHVDPYTSVCNLYTQSLSVKLTLPNTMARLIIT